MKYANDIIKEIKARGPIEIPEGCFASEDFDIWMHKEAKGEVKEKEDGNNN